VTSRGEPPANAFLQSVEDQITDAFSADSVEEILRRLDALQTPWAEETKKTLVDSSPTSLKVSFDALHRHKNLALKEVFSREMKIAKNIMTDGDFVEGVSALLVDKRKPKWRRQLNEISTTDSYFL